MDGDLATLADVKAMLGTLGSPLTAAVSASDTTLAVIATKDFPASGYVAIDDETIAYTAKTDTTFTTCTRGQLGTIATTHLAGARVARVVDDGVLANLIAGASMWVKVSLGDPILEETRVRAPYSGPGGVVLVLSRRPVSLVAEVRIDGVSIPRSSGPLVAGYLHDQTAVYLRGSYRFHRGIKNVEVTNTAGYAADAIPRDIQELVIDVVVNAMRDRDRGGVQSKSLAGETVTYFDRYASARGRQVLSVRRNVVPAA